MYVNVNERVCVLVPPASTNLVSTYYYQCPCLPAYRANISGPMSGDMSSRAIQIVRNLLVACAMVHTMVYWWLAQADAIAVPYQIAYHVVSAPYLTQLYLTTHHTTIFRANAFAAVPGDSVCNHLQDTLYVGSLGICLQAANTIWVLSHSRRAPT